MLRYLAKDKVHKLCNLPKLLHLSASVRAAWQKKVDKD